MRRVRLEQFALGVAHQIAGANIAGRQLDVCLALWCIARFRLDFLLDLASKSIGIGEADLDLGSFACLQVVHVSFTRQRGGERRLAAAVVTVEVVDDARGGALQRAAAWSWGLADKSLQGLEGWICEFLGSASLKSSMKSPRLSVCFPRDSGRDHQP